MHVMNFLMAEVQLFTLGPWVDWFLINGASQPGGQDDTALLPLFDMLNHDVRQEVSSQTSRCFYTVLQMQFIALWPCHSLNLLADALVLSLELLLSIPCQQLKHLLNVEQTFLK